MCIDFRALNAVTICESFPLSRIEEVLQAVKATVWFTSFDLAQGYLQLAMDEVDIHKLHFTLAHLVDMSLLVCHLGCQMQVPPSAISWRCV